MAPLPFALAGLALVLVAATHLVDFGADHLRVGGLDAAAEWSWSHVASTAAFGVAALAGVVGARRAAGPRQAWLAVAVLFGLLFVDSVTRLHTHISVWPLLYAPILLGVSFASWRLARDTREAVVVVAGLATLLVSLAIHVFGPHVVSALGWGTHSWAYQIKVALKEGLELAGWVLVVPALWRLVRDLPGN